jgi:hypothetical protein
LQRWIQAFAGSRASQGACSGVACTPLGDSHIPLGWPTIAGAEGSRRNFAKSVTDRRHEWGERCTPTGVLQCWPESFGCPGLPQHFYRLPAHRPGKAESPLFPRSFLQSGRHDSNMRPPGPKPGALARLSYAPMTRAQLGKTGSRSAIEKYTGSAGTREGVPANRLKLADQSVINSSSRSNSSGLANGITIRPAPLLLA